MMAKFQSAEPLTAATWYSLDQTSNVQNPASTKLGGLEDVSYTTDTALASAIDNRTTRIIVNQLGGHAKDYFSKDSMHYIAKYFEQTLQYNCGNITDPATVPMSEHSSTFMIRETLDLLAMFACSSALLLWQVCCCTEEIRRTAYGMLRTLHHQKEWDFLAGGCAFDRKHHDRGIFCCNKGSHAGIQE